VKLISWNVNGLRAVLKKNFLEFLDAEKPDVLCLQEIKCTPDQVEPLWPASLHNILELRGEERLFRHGNFHKKTPAKSHAAHRHC
jgi:exonuclease III